MPREVYAENLFCQLEVFIITLSTVLINGFQVIQEKLSPQNPSPDYVLQNGDDKHYYHLSLQGLTLSSLKKKKPEELSPYLTLMFISFHCSGFLWPNYFCIYSVDSQI